MNKKGNHKIKNLLLGSALLSSILFAGGDIAPVEPVVVEIPVANTWSFEFEPYMIIASMSGDSKIGRSPTVEIDMDFGDILEKLDIGAIAHFEALHQSGWGIWLDYGFMDLSSDITGPIGGVTDMRMRQGTLEAFAMYRQPLGSGNIDYLAGIRWWDNDIDVSHNLLPLDVEVKEDWVDPVIGARWSTKINENWKFSVLGTVGGFGIGSDLTASGSVGVKYVINDLLDLDLQYKALWADYESGTKGQKGYFAYDVTTYGPIIGLNFKF